MEQSREHPATILIVEDEGVVALALEQQLREAGYRVAGVATTGQAAIDQAEALAPDLVLMDIHLSGKLDGIHAAKAIHDRRRTPVVFLAAYAEAEMLQRARETLPYGYLVKPFDLRELHATIEMALARRRSDTAVEAAEERLRLAVEAAELGTFDLNPEAGKLIPGGRLSQLFGKPPEALGEDCQAFLRRVHPEDRQRIEQAIDAALKGGHPLSAVFRAVHSDGAVRWFEAHGNIVAGDGGRPPHVFGVVRDITERRAEEARLQDAAAALEAAADAIVVTGLKGDILSVNPAFCTMSGYSPEEAIGKHWTLVSAGPELDAPDEDLVSTVERSGRWQREIGCRRKDGELFPGWLSINTVPTREGEPAHYVAVLTDLSRLRRAEARVQHLAYHDPLTGLPNRLLFRERLEQGLASAERHRSRCALLFLDLDHFKLINDTLGHSAGDVLLQSVASRLREAVRREDTVARLGGDEFAVLIEGVAEIRGLGQVAEKILAGLGEPLNIDGARVLPRASLGVSVYPDDGHSGEALMKAADMALYSAKADGRGAYRVYNRELSRKLAERRLYEEGLREALEGGIGLALHYQPQVALPASAIVGAEVLLRWEDATLGEVPPARFIPIAEESGLITALGRWVLLRACREASAWPGLRIAVNCSARELLAPNFTEGVRQALAETGLAPERLELEITESTLHDLARSADLLAEIRTLGVRIAVDDFGVGYSSLSALKYLPLDRLKIDQSFIRDVPGDPGDAAIVSAIVGLGHTLGLKVMAEGVETEAQLAFLNQLGCCEAQGYLIARPMPAEALSAFIARALRVTDSQVESGLRD